MLSPEFDNIPDELKSRSQWLLWRLETRAGQTTKVPYQPDGCKAAVDKPATWIDYETAKTAYLKGNIKFDGVGFVLTAADPIVGVDLDKCLTPETGKLDPLAAEIIANLPTYCEVSPSGQGLRLFAFGSLPPGRRRKGLVEMYGKGRYLTVTGRRFTDHAAIVDCTTELAAVHRCVFGTVPPPQTPPPTKARLTDQQLLEKAAAARHGADFTALWSGDTSAYGDDDSRADLALCNHLAFWTGKDLAQMDRLFRQSKLFRPKWDEKRGDAGTYGQITLAKAIAGTRDAPTNPRGPKQADTLVALVIEECELWHDLQGEPHASIKGPIAASYSLKSTAFRDWLSHKHYKQTEKSPSSNALQEALTTLSGLAKFDGPEHSAWLRIARHHDALYLDLADDQWRCVEITADGWQIIPRPPVRFVRSKAMRPLPSPTPGGSLDELWPLLNVDEQDHPLIYGWLFASLRDESTPFAQLALIGGQGSAKSWNARILRSLIDPNAAPLRTFPKDESDLFIAARSGHVVAMDNLSGNGFKDWLSDALCRLLTGGGLSKRAQYTDAEEFVLPDTRRPILATSIDLFINRQDLLDRTFIVRLPSIPPSRRRTESELQDEFNQVHPRILGALLDGVSAALAEAYRAPPPDLPRLADAAKWIHGAETSLHMPGRFLTTFRDHYREMVESGLEQSSLYKAIKGFLKHHVTWTGTAGELLEELRKTPTGDFGDAAPRLPKDATHLSSQLNRMDAALREVGINAVFHPRNRTRRELTLSKGG